MTTSQTYRRTKEYHLVFCKLVAAARSESQVFYTEIAEILGAGHGEPANAGEVGDLLGEISEEEHAAGRPMLAAVVTTGKGIPGNVFFAHARRLGLLVDTDPTSEMTFWTAERGRVFEEWRPVST